MVDKERKFEPEIYKKFWRTKTAGGFLAIRSWFDAGKLSLDIGETAPEGGLVSNTIVWTPVVPFATYLRAITTNTARTLYPATGTAAPETFLYFGGSNTEQGPVSRIIKVAYWSGATTGEAFEFKAGHFKAQESSSGAFLPDMKSPLSQNKIKILRREMAEMSYILDLTVQAYTSKENWLSHLHGKERS